ncbi:hypothetical protein NUU61_004700 [Penicillium alfredii]|uniref:Uncharacterized protein n=1 Tax=Penicillium alfredii TaxID=1506179 RepID=A0A9W9F8B6_9EURO|nr:uncharacterized protein NUU61_004700 [Penicillium alfredii]KAJ5095344.1 hypothetical protein NUU61_004700 [Penicillium alfredii]
MDNSSSDSSFSSLARERNTIMARLQEQSHILRSYPEQRTEVIAAMDDLTCRLEQIKLNGPSEARRVSLAGSNPLETSFVDHCNAFKTAVEEQNNILKAEPGQSAEVARQLECITRGMARLTLDDPAPIKTGTFCTHC